MQPLHFTNTAKIHWLPKDLRVLRLLEFEHIVQVNDLTDDKLQVMSRNKLWQGLILRATHPEKFNSAVHCHSTKQRDNEYIRKIRAGDTQFTEQVTLYPDTRIDTTTLPGIDQIQAISSTIIEEPEPDSLFVRFQYKRELDAGPGTINVAEYLKSAYVQLDRDAISLIRMLAESESRSSS